MMLKWNRAKQEFVERSVRIGCGEPEGEIDHPDEFDAHSSLSIIAKQGMRLLHRNFPGHFWVIQINVKGRMFNVFNHALHDNWGYTIRASDLERSSINKIFIRAGGEILERFGMNAGRFNLDNYAKLQKDSKGRCIPVHLIDLNTPEAKKELKKQKLNAAISRGQFMQTADGHILVPVH